MVPPHFEQLHRTSSFMENCAGPYFLIFSRFSIILILYLVRYLLSSLFNLSHGNVSHPKQNPAPSFCKLAQFFMLHLVQLADLLISGPLQPGHLFLSRRYAMQMPQFIPHGAIIEISSRDSINCDLLLFILQGCSDSDTHYRDHHISQPDLGEIIPCRHPEHRNQYRHIKQYVYAKPR